MTRREEIETLAREYEQRTLFGYLPPFERNYYGGYFCGVLNASYRPPFHPPESLRIWELGFADGKGDLERAIMEDDEES